MNTRRLTTTGVALVAALSLGLAGCGNTGSNDGPASPPASSATPQQEPREELAAAAQKLNEDSAKLTFAMAGIKGTGALDPAAKKMRASLDMGMGGQATKMDMIVVGEDIYMKMDGLASASGKWLHIDATQLPAGNELRQMGGGDPAGIKNLLNAVTDVQRVSEHNFTGTIDFTKSPTADPQMLKALGDKAKALPFTAKTDEQGRLTELTVDMAAIQPALGQLKATYSDFGSPVTVEKPAASEVEEASADLLRAFGA